MGLTILDGASALERPSEPPSAHRNANTVATKHEPVRWWHRISADLDGRSNLGPANGGDPLRM